MWRRSAIPTGQTQNVVFFGRSMAERHGKRSYTRTKTPAASMSLSIPTTPTFFLLRCGKRGVRHGVYRVVVPAAVCIARTMGERRGSHLLSTGFPQARTERLA